MTTSFDWPQFLDRHHIHYRDRGSNVGPDHIVTTCPFCGPADQSGHMSISLLGNGWRCWREHSHSGIAPTRLIQALLNCSHEQALTYLSSLAQPIFAQPAKSLPDIVNVLMTRIEPAPPKPIEMPPTARPLTITAPVARPYQLYLSSRGFSDLHTLTDRYGLRFDPSDRRWHGRILFPITHDNRMVAFTGRAISNRATPRYLAEAITQSTPLIWTDTFPPQADTLVLTEGPFDALKVNVLGQLQGVHATCCMTSSFSDHQRAQLYDLIPRFQRTIVLFDRGNEASAYRLAQSFPNRLAVARLPSYASDPAELTALDWSL